MTGMSGRSRNAVRRCSRRRFRFGRGRGRSWPPPPEASVPSGTPLAAGRTRYPTTSAGGIRVLEGCRWLTGRLDPLREDEQEVLEATPVDERARVLPVTSPKMLVHRHLSPMVDAGILLQPEQACRGRSWSEP